MHHQHFFSIHSTQLFLKDNLEKIKMNHEDILISCSNQTNGIGRNENSWDTYPNSLAMSFTLRPNISPTLTPLEIGLLATRYIHDKFRIQLKLKWPNDLLTLEGKKCGGILCQYIDPSTIIVGFGLNLGKLNTPTTTKYPLGLGNVIPDFELKEFDQEQISAELYLYLLRNRYSDFFSLENDFKKNCYHLNQQVLIIDNGVEFTGKFLGIGTLGEAMVETNFQIHCFITSSLRVIN